MNEFCKNLPKIELHAHLNGSLSPAILRKLGCFSESIEEYQSLNNLLERNSRTLDECFRLFKVAHDVTNTRESVYTATQYVIKEFYDDNIIYLELRTTPRACEDMTKQEYIETVIKAIEENQNDIIVKLLLCIDRRHSIDISKEVLDLIIKMRNKYPDIVKGIDLCGNPNVGVFDSNLFRKARDNRLNLSLHCAEVKNDREVKEILNLRPDRIGHGTCLHPSSGGSQELWYLYCENPIPIECCLTSNIICGTSKSYKEHHVSEWLNNDLPFSISTDDKGVFNTSLSLEYELLQKHFDLDKYKLWKINFDSIDHSFASAPEKDKLKNVMLEWKDKNIK